MPLQSNGGWPLKYKLLIVLGATNLALILAQEFLTRPGKEGISKIYQAGSLVELQNSLTYYREFRPFELGTAQGLDWLFIPAYVSLISGMWLVAGGDSLAPRWLKWIGAASIAAILTSGFLDVKENLLIFQAMHGSVADASAQMWPLEKWKNTIPLVLVAGAAVAMAYNRYRRGRAQ